MIIIVIFYLLIAAVWGNKVEYIRETRANTEQQQQILFARKKHINTI